MAQAHYCLTPLGQQLVIEWLGLVERKARQFARHHQIDPEDCRSAAQEILVRLVATHDPSRGTLDGLVRIRVWLELIDWCRRRHPAITRRRRCVALAEDVEPSDGGREAELMEVRLLAEMLIDSASVADRPLLRARYREGLSQADIGRRLGYTRTRIGQRLHAAEAAIRSTLGIAPPPPPAPGDVVEHPDWPGYAADRERNIWSFRKSRPRILAQPLKNKRPSVHLMHDVLGLRYITVADFLATHPLHRREAG